MADNAAPERADIGSLWTRVPKYFSAGRITNALTLAGLVVVTALEVSGFWPKLKDTFVATKAANEIPHDVTDDVQITKLKTYLHDHTTLFYVTYKVDVVNRWSAGFTIPYDIFEISVFPLEKAPHIDGAHGLVLHLPPDPLDITEESTGWRGVGCISHSIARKGTLAAARVARGSSKCGAQIASDGGLTADVGPGVTYENTYHAIIRAKSGDFVGLTVDFPINGCDDYKLDNCTTQQEVRQLP